MSTPTPTDWSAQREPTTIQKLEARVDALEKRSDSLARSNGTIIKALDLIRKMFKEIS